MVCLNIFVFLLIRVLLVNCDQVLANGSSNCSLSLNIETVSTSAILQKSYPLELTANFNFTCESKNFSAFYNLITLERITFTDVYNDFQSMIELNTTRFQFSIFQSSTLRLCVIFTDVETYQICRQIHVGINYLYSFWTTALKILYICLLCPIAISHLIFFLQVQWKKGGSKQKAKRATARRVSVVEHKHDTFETEKVNEEDEDDDDDDDNYDGEDDVEEQAGDVAGVNQGES